MITFECSMCGFYSMWDGSCMNPNSPHFGENRTFESACSELTKDEED